MVGLGHQIIVQHLDQVSSARALSDRGHSVGGLAEPILDPGHEARPEDSGGAQFKESSRDRAIAPPLELVSLHIAELR